MPTQAFMVLFELETEIGINLKVVCRMGRDICPSFLVALRHKP